PDGNRPRVGEGPDWAARVPRARRHDGQPQLHEAALPQLDRPDAPRREHPHDGRRRADPPEDGLVPQLMLALALIVLLLGVFLTLEAVQAPARERRALLRRAATYGKPKDAPTPASNTLGERMGRALEMRLANAVLKLNPKTNVDLVRKRLI